MIVAINRAHIASSRILRAVVCSLLPDVHIPAVICMSFMEM